MITRHEEHEEDQDSLFGSPPPSPRLRASSPALSLPFANICDDERRLSISIDTQNVGTIALPGSHPYFELPVNPLALSLNHTAVHRPPAQSHGQPVPTSPWKQTHPSPASNKASIAKGSKRSRQPSQSPSCNISPPQSRDPEFSLPDPSAPPPAHFLRNQQNLLGKAGLVAGVKPATITHIRGTTPSNPITIDDEDIPTPSRIVSGQKDIFPVLEGILALIGKGSTRYIPTPPRQTQDEPVKHPSVKRRKLNCVPAGAADWDVPYPFKEGEGPDEYYKTWQRERGKHLAAQLVKLIKGASTQNQGAVMWVQPTDIAPPPFPSSSTTINEQEEYPKPAPVPDPLSPPRPTNTISQPRQEEILRRAREKRWQVQKELDRVKAQLWETTIEQAALVHLLKRSEKDESSVVGINI